MCLDWQWDFAVSVWEKYDVFHTDISLVQWAAEKVINILVFNYHGALRTMDKFRRKMGSFSRSKAWECLFRRAFERFHIFHRNDLNISPRFILWLEQRHLVVIIFLLPFQFQFYFTNFGRRVYSFRRICFSRFSEQQWLRDLGGMTRNGTLSFIHTTLYFHLFERRVLMCIVTEWVWLSNATVEWQILFFLMFVFTIDTTYAYDCMFAILKAFPDNTRRIESKRF